MNVVIISHDDSRCLYFYFSPDHPIHVPASGEDPWQADFYPSKGYVIKSKNGVFQLYKDDESLNKDEPIPFPYVSLETYITDLNRISAIVVDGPL